MFDEKTIKLLYDKAQSLGLKPNMLTDYGVMSIEVKGDEKYIFHSTSVLNTQLSSYLSTNKHASRVIFEHLGLPNIPYCLPSTMLEANEFLKKHKTIIAKPTKGKHSKDVHLIENAEDFKHIDLTKYLLEKFIEGKEERYLILNDKILAVHRKVYKTPINNPETVKRVAYEKIVWDKEVVKISRNVTTALGLAFAAVDFLITTNGRTYILEVNSAPGLSRFQYPDEGPSIDIASIFLEASIKKMNHSNTTR